jgi:S-formylglutathione hydrolase FrmB
MVFLIDDRATNLNGADPVDGPFWTEPQPLFGTYAALGAGSEAIIDDQSDCFPVTTNQLVPGRYRAQARLDIHRNNSNWKREPGNLWSDAVAFEVQAGSGVQRIELLLNHRVEPKQLPKVEGTEWFEMRSELLSRFRGREVMLRAGVVLPRDYDPKRRYPAIYEVPGFGDDHLGAASGRGRNAKEGEAGLLARSTFRIVLDPEGPNGHTLFVDSSNNGPCGQALVTELLPALEAKYPLIAASSARLLRGHSSGGWSTLWLATEYPTVFGAAWSSAPDPVDFRRFQKVDIYSQVNFYIDPLGKDLPSLRSRDQVQMTIRQESRGEDVLGPNNTSAQQWDSWFATFGPKDSQHNPAALFDPKTGVIDKNVANSYRQYDICDRLRQSPQTYMPIFRNNIRLICGTEDSFYLNEAVTLLDEELKRLGQLPSDRGYVKLIPGDHGTVFMHPAMRAIPKEMLDHLREAKHIP